MLIKKFLAMSVLIALMLTLCGCDFFTMETEQMLTPPMLIGDMAPIQEVIKSSIKGEYTLKYPSSGEYRSAVILNDIDSDGKFEAFVLYSQTEDDVDYMHLNFIKQKGGEWVSIADKRLAAVGVERVDFAGIHRLLQQWCFLQRLQRQNRRSDLQLSFCRCFHRLRRAQLRVG